MLNLARASQLMYYPEFLPDAHRALGLPSGSAADRPTGISESFGTLRYGKLLEMLDVRLPAVRDAHRTQRDIRPTAN